MMMMLMKAGGSCHVIIIAIILTTTMVVMIDANVDANSLANRAAAMSRFRAGLQLGRAKLQAKLSQQQKRALVHSQISLTSAPKWWHYYPPWWLPPKADKELPQPDWSHSDLGSYTINPQDDVVPYYNPYDTIMLEEEFNVFGKAASETPPHPWQRAYVSGKNVPARLQPLDRHYNNNYID